MKAWTEKLASYAPPMWLIAATAAVMAALLLATFVDTLQLHMRQGDALRQAQGVAAGHSAFAAVADAPTARSAQLKLR